MVDEKNKMQNILIENRQKLNVSGVIEIINFDEQIVCVNTELGLLTVKGIGLKLNKLNIDNTELMIEGEVLSLVYTDNYSKSGFFKKLFK